MEDRVTSDVSELVKSEERFWRKVDRRGVGECWPWTAKARTNWGYGVFRVSAKYGVEGAHRMAVILSSGSLIPDGMFVLHSCDNPACCNPAHLSLGTPMENMRQMRARGRDRSVDQSGERNGNARLTWDDVRAMRASGLNGVKAARQWGISPAQAQNILRGASWREAA